MNSTLAVFLLIVGFDDGGVAREKLTNPMPSMEVCLQASQAAKIDGAKSGDAQTVVAIACITGDPKDRTGCYPSKDGNPGEAWPCELRERAKP